MLVFANSCKRCTVYKDMFNTIRYTARVVEDKTLFVKNCSCIYKKNAVLDTFCENLPKSYHNYENTTKFLTHLIALKTHTNS